jgi:hypothetical protein
LPIRARTAPEKSLTNMKDERFHRMKLAMMQNKGKVNYFQKEK